MKRQRKAIMEKRPESSRNPFLSLTREKVLSDISLSEKQIDEGKGMDAAEAVRALMRKHHSE